LDSDARQIKKTKVEAADSPETLPLSKFSDAPLSQDEKTELMERLKTLDAAGDFAIPTTDSGFKHLLSTEPGNEKTIVSFLNAFVPTFRVDPVKSVSAAPTAIPALPYASLKQTFMDVHVISQSGAHYVIEMQAKRHVNFDERALFYACATYSRQIQEEGFKDPVWYKTLKPVIGIQVLDYDTNRARGIKDEDIKDTLIERVKQNPLLGGEFLKHYLMTCQKSSQKLDHLQLIQIELGRVTKQLYPPRSDFNELDWWLSTFKFAGKYTEDYINELNTKGIVMPEPIKLGFERLRYSKWNPRDLREYKTDIIDREDNIVMLAIERAEGKEEGREEGEQVGLQKGREEEKKNMAHKMLAKGMKVEEVSEMTGLPIEEINTLNK
jgi:predicted transposase/invertase (TIGR01784 family)